jgi:hypothetical protein
MDTGERVTVQVDIRIYQPHGLEVRHHIGNEVKLIPGDASWLVEAVVTSPLEDAIMQAAALDALLGLSTLLKEGVDTMLEASPELYNALEHRVRYRQSE